MTTRTGITVTRAAVPSMRKDGSLGPSRVRFAVTHRSREFFRYFASAEKAVAFATRLAAEWGAALHVAADV